MSDVPRPEYPRPQFVRTQWLNLNGTWQFELDQADTGLQRGLLGRELTGSIQVPFCPESRLSGIEHVDFLNAVWYRRELTVPAEWAGRDVLLHFGAVDYDATVWANGQRVARHRGGNSPFSCDLTGIAAAGEPLTIVVRAQDDSRKPRPRGKQCPEYANTGCLYTRTTGIWQTVWLEPVPQAAFRRPKVVPDLSNSCFHLSFPLRGARPGLRVVATLWDEHGQVSCADVPVHDFTALATLPVPADRRRLWSLDDPHLYTLTYELRDVADNLLDEARGYAGLRSVTFDGKKILINGQVVFQRLVLDQGYYPDGILTAPSDQALIDDIKLSVAAGFNGARLHQKVFEERFLYHADRLGYLVWGEFPDWGIDRANPSASYVAEWLEVLERDVSHPAIVGWCPLNETAQTLPNHNEGLDDITQALWLATKLVDGTRPVLDTSGYSHRVLETDVYDSHDYDQNPDTFAARHAGLVDDKPYVNGPADRPWSLPYRGQPYFVSEFGGIWWNPHVKEGEPSWGYGDRPQTEEEFMVRFERLCAALLDHPDMFGYCYTQLTDVFQEQNGIYFFDRTQKYDLARVKAAQVRQAKIEE